MRYFMKLAQALKHRNDLENQLMIIRRRLMNNAQVQEGESPIEDPLQLIQELDEVSRELQSIMTRINLTNAVTQTAEGTLTQLLAKREVLMQQRNILDEFTNQASDVIHRHSANEIKVLPSVDVPETRKLVDRYSKALRELEMLIQETNWTTDLIE